MLYTKDPVAMYHIMVKVSVAGTAVLITTEAAQQDQNVFEETEDFIRYGSHVQTACSVTEMLKSALQSQSSRTGAWSTRDSR